MASPPRGLKCGQFGARPKFAFIFETAENSQIPLNGSDFDTNKDENSGPASTGKSTFDLLTFDLIPSVVSPLFRPIIGSNGSRISDLFVFVSCRSLNCPGDIELVVANEKGDTCQ